MNIEQIYTNCLAQGAYYITSEGEAAIIDPLRETRPYIDRATKDGVKIKYVFETHFHADFVSGHLDLSKQTGAPIVYGPNANPEFEAIIAKDGQEFKIGKLTLLAMHTPGHTMESTCYLLRDESGKDIALFSGDTLFLGDVGRPDLAQKSASMTQEQLAGMLYDSLMTKIMPLADDVTVYPAHGAGSACGKNMMKETVDTLGNQKKMNYALNQPDKASFIREVTDGLLPPPGYFGMNVAMNKKGYDNFDVVLSKGLKAIKVEELAAVLDITGALLLDVRSAGDFSKGFILVLSILDLKVILLHGLEPLSWMLKLHWCWLLIREMSKRQLPDWHVLDSIMCSDISKADLMPGKRPDMKLTPLTVSPQLNSKMNSLKKRVL